jgi:hypothetical protein
MDVEDTIAMLTNRVLLLERMVQAQQFIDNSRYRVETMKGGLSVGDDFGFYIGDKDTNGTWLITRSGNDLVIQRRESGAYVTKSTISA